MQRALSELLAALRRAGMPVSSAEAIDALRVAQRVGLADRAELQRALRVTLAKSPADGARFGKIFDAYFDAQGANQGDLYQRLRARGFAEEEVGALRALIDAGAAHEQGGRVYRALAEGPFAVERLIEAGVRQVGAAPLDDPARTGFVAMRVLDALRFGRAEARLSTLRISLRAALGGRGDELGDAIADELAALRDGVRRQVADQLGARSTHRSLDEVPFGELNAAEARRVERAVRELAERLLGRAVVRARRARRGRLHVPATMRSALATGGAPFLPKFRGRTPRAPKLVILCDVSDSVRSSARFMLLFMHVAQRLFAASRSFVFVGDVRDATEIFRRQRPERAIELAYRGGIVNVADNSHYGRVFRQLLAEHAGALDARTTLVVLGDGRGNHFDPGEQAFRSLCARVSRSLWLAPEPQGRWATGDSALPLYRRHASEVLPVYDLATLRAAARELARF